jgi:2-phosphoglycolate phosphatase
MALLFDLDGTLLDTAPDFAYVINQLRLEQHKAPLQNNELSDIPLAVTGGLSHLLGMALQLPHTHPEVSQPFLHPIGQRLLELYQQNLSRHTRFFPGIENLLHTLEKREILWGIVTNKPSQQTNLLLNKLGLDTRAACIVSGDTTPYAKPHPAPLLHACELIEVSPTHCVYVGDAERDILAGKAAGMTTIGALFGYIENNHTARTWGADHYVQHADEIFPWFENHLQRTL